jgi:hypothetical protein
MNRDWVNGGHQQSMKAPGKILPWSIMKILEKDNTFALGILGDGGEEMKMDRQSLHPAANTVETPAEMAGKGSVAGSSAMESVVERACMDESAARESQKPEGTSSEPEKSHGLVFICVYCKKIRDDKGVWNQIESFLCDHPGTEFSHLICPDCYERAVKDFQLQ